MTVPEHAQPDRLREHVRQLTTTLHPRGWSEPGHLERTAAYIAQQLEGLGLVPTSQRFSAEGLPYRNITVQLGPATGPVVVVGAHTDTW